MQLIVVGDVAAAIVLGIVCSQLLLSQLLYCVRFGGIVLAARVKFQVEGCLPRGCISERVMMESGF